MILKVNSWGEKNVASIELKNTTGSAKNSNTKTSTATARSSAIMVEDERRPIEMMQKTASAKETKNPSKMVSYKSHMS